jgi:AcrR family transcriptional regulator
MTQDVDDHVRRLWRHRGTSVPFPRRGPRPQLGLDDILDVAVALADADGLEAVSTRAVAARFGKTAMALYPYVGTKENLLALMQDHACALPGGQPTGNSLAEALEAWAVALFDLYLRHPWLTRRPWSQTSQGPNEQDWLERLLQILDTWSVPPRPAAVTMLYATVRACAETDAAYRRMDRDGAADWLARAESIRTHLPDLPARYPRSTALPPLSADWRDAPRAALLDAVHLLASALGTD